MKALGFLAQWPRPDPIHFTKQLLPFRGPKIQLLVCLRFFGWLFLFLKKKKKGLLEWHFHCLKLRTRVLCAGESVGSEKKVMLGTGRGKRGGSSDVCLVHASCWDRLHSHHLLVWILSGTVWADMIWAKPFPGHMLAVKHNGQLAVQCLSSFPGPVFSSAAVTALESFGWKTTPHYTACDW